MKTLIALGILAALGDTATFLMLPVGAEANPLVSGLTPAAAVMLKAGLVMLAIAAAGEEEHRGYHAYSQAILGVLIFACAFGFGSNVSVLLP